MITDIVGKSFIKSYEGLMLHPYLCPRGKPTIGWGHTHGVSMETPAITEQEAEKFFEQDIDFAERAVNLAKVELTQNEFNALVSFCFNVGSKEFRSSTLLKLLDEGNKAAASKQFERWIFYHDPITHAPRISEGLVKRRARELSLFLET